MNTAKSVPASSARAAWGKLQLESKARGLTIDALVRERGKRRTKPVTLRLPTAFLDVIQSELSTLGIPASHLPHGLAAALLGLQLSNDCDVWTGYIYANRQSAVRAATKLFALDRARETTVLRYRDGAGVTDELFRSPLRNLHAA